MIRLTIEGIQETCEEGTSFLELAKKHQKNHDHQILLAKINGKLTELHKTAHDGDNVTFLTSADRVGGSQAYIRSVLLLFLKSFYQVAGEEHVQGLRVLFSIRKGLLIDYRTDFKVDMKFLKKVKAAMKEAVEMGMPIVKKEISTGEARSLFARRGMQDKEKLFRYRRASTVNVYRLGDYVDYFYGFMVHDCSVLKYFDLSMYDRYIVLQLPNYRNPEVIPPFEPQPKVYSTLLESEALQQRMGVATVGDLNEVISSNRIQELILVHEALQEAKLARIAQTIAQRKEIRFVMIAGPSSSGKTTTSRRLGIQLKAHGITPHQISVDNYFVNRVDTPLGPDGEKNYECLEAIDVEQFNKDMLALMEGERVELPYYNFMTGVREYKGDYLQLGKDDVLLIEGIHALNDAMSYSMPRESKFKIYLSALTQLNIDEHNRIRTTDGRLIRRMIRDARTRGNSAQMTLNRWDAVRLGEEANIFPYQEDADVVFDSSLIYEMAAMKPFAEALLFQIPEDCPESMEATRLLKFLDYFLAIDTARIPVNSLLREFIGGSCFEI